MIEGPVIHDALKTAMADPRYPMMADEVKARYLQKVVNRVRGKYGRALDVRMIERNPQFLKYMANDLQQAVIDNPALAPSQSPDDE